MLGLAKEASEYLWWDKMDQNTLPILLSTRQHNAKSWDLFANPRKWNSVPWVSGILLLKAFHLKTWTSYIYEQQHCGFSTKQKSCSQLCDWEENMPQPGTVTLQRCPLQTSPQSPAALGPWAEESCKDRFPGFSHTAFWAWGGSCGQTYCMEKSLQQGRTMAQGMTRASPHLS